MSFVSDFWFGSDKEDIKYTTSSYSLIKMASFRRAVANFVTITTGKTIPVVYNAKDKSFTNGKVVVLSAQIPNAQIDAAVGLALHEATHIIREDWGWLENFDSHIPEAVYNRALSKPELELTRKKVAKRIHGFWNWVRDRSNDAWYYDQAPGYRGYYTALYRKYFYRPIIDVALQSSKFRTPSWKGYSFRIINLHNKHRDLDALPELREIWDLIDLKNIIRLETSQDAFIVALKIWNIVIENLINPPKVKKPKSSSSTENAMTQNELDELDEETLKQLMEQTSPPESDDSESDGGQSLPLPDDTEWEDEPDEPDEENKEDSSGETKDAESDDTENGENEKDDDWENNKDLVDIGDSSEDEKETDDGETNENGQKLDSNDKTNETDNEITDTKDDGSDEQNTDDNDTSDNENGDEEGADFSDKNTAGNSSNNEAASIQDEEIEPEDLTKKEEKLLEKAMAKQDEFLDKGIEKSELTKEQNSTLKQMEKSGASVETTGKEFAKDGIKTVVIRKLNESMLDDLPIGNSYPVPMSEKAVLEGIRLGRILANKLQIRNETNVTIFTRKRTGKLDRRLIHAIGFSDAICKQTFYDEYGDALIHISIDASSSMGSADKWKKTIATAVAIAKATETIDKLEVIISFRTTTTIGKNSNEKIAALVVIAYDSRFDKFIKIKKIFPRLAPNGWTPEGLAYEAIMKEILQSVAGKEGYFINFSDGQPYCPQSNRSYSAEYSGIKACQHTKKQVKMMTDNKIKVLSFFIDSSYGSSEYEFKLMYGENSSFINVEQIMNVAKVINKKLLIK